MRKILVVAVCGLMALPPSTVAEDHGRGPPPPAHWNDGKRPAPQYYGGYRHYGTPGAYARPVYVVRPPVYYRYPVRYPYYYGHNNHSDNDDALWAIGGFVLGAILVGAAQQSAATAPATTSPSAAPPPGPAENCYDDIVHDSAGNPHVQRHCYPVASP